MKDNVVEKKKGLNLPLTAVSVGFLLIVVLCLALKPAATVNTIQNIFDRVLEGTGPFLLLFDLFLIVLGFGIAFSKYGKIKLGEGRPEYSTFSYIAMMACAALASASMFWSFTEWANYIITPGLNIEPYSEQAYDIAVGYTFFHWGFLAQCIYVLVGLVTAYAIYVRKIKSLKMSDIVSNMLGENFKFKGLKKVLLWLVDIIVIFCTLAGLGVSLGLGVPVIAGGINAVTGIEVNFLMQVIIVLGIGIIFSWSSFVGTGRGMKFLSDNTVKLLGVFLVIILILGPTSFIFKSFVNGLGEMGGNFIEMALFSDPIQQTGFAESWTIFFIAFPLSYTGLMAVFVAKISKGRSIKELVLCCM
ncbi:MAG: BCCT family transporter, partial [Anaerovoracaceae bacterium]